MELSVPKRGPLMRRRFALLSAIVLILGSWLGARAARPARVDAFASSPANLGLVPEAASPLLVRGRTLVQSEPRLGVPTFLWAAARSVPAGVNGAEDAARRYLADYAKLYRLDAADVAAATMAQVHDTGQGVIIVAFKESVEGIEVFRESLR